MNNSVVSIRIVKWMSSYSKDFLLMMLHLQCQLLPFMFFSNLCSQLVQSIWRLSYILDIQQFSTFNPTEISIFYLLILHHILHLNLTCSALNFLWLVYVISWLITPLFSPGSPCILEPWNLNHVQPNQFQSNKLALELKPCVWSCSCNSPRANPSDCIIHSATPWKKDPVAFHNSRMSEAFIVVLARRFAPLIFQQFLAFQIRCLLQMNGNITFLGFEEMKMIILQITWLHFMSLYICWVLLMKTSSWKCSCIPLMQMHANGFDL